TKMAILRATAHNRRTARAIEQASASSRPERRGAMWEWLADPQVQKTLGWLGGGVAAVVAAGWAVVKFALGRPKPRTVITADRGGMVAGRDNININRMPPPPTAERRR